jgi:hypothetical protein
MNETHMRVMTAALETFTRLLMGQINIVFEQVPGCLYADRELMQKVSRQIKPFSHIPTNSSYGIGSNNLDDRANVAYEMKKILDKFEYEVFTRPELDPDAEEIKHLDIIFQEPLKVSREPLIKIEEQKKFEFDKDLLDLSLIPNDRGLCANCDVKRNNTCELKEILNEHRSLQKIYETKFYENIDPGSWEEWSVDEPIHEKDADNKISITWCPCHVKKNKAV